ncbi:condensin complex protein MksE [Halomonas garicola]|uniref:condensin complex protein MksE n=1 Tax=Halomonas garicola TaxID=1690008 RepID=UPI0028A016F6|nr:hypothetical protein [Halomonas garicola]
MHDDYDTPDSPQGPVVNRRLSQEAFRQLTAGSVINQHCIRDGEPVANPLFQELYKERDRYYVGAYANMGMELVQRPGFFYVRSLAGDDSEDPISSAAIRPIQGVLLVLGRGVLEAGYMFDLLTTHEAGASPALLEQIGSNTTMQQILAACHIDRPLPEAAKIALFDRHIAYYNARGHLVLADAGQAFFNDIFQEEQAETPE